MPMKDSLRQQLERLAMRLTEIDASLADPRTSADLARYRALAKEQAEVQALVDLWRRYEQAEFDLEGARGMLADPEMAELAREEAVNAEATLTQLQAELQAALMPRDPDDERNAFVEIRAGTGGDESALFATNAWKIGAPGEMTPAPEFVGRKLLRPGLIGLPRIATALKASGYDFAADEGLGSLPDPISGRPHFRFREVKGLPKNSVIEGSYATLIDVDHDTKLDKNPKLAAATDPDKLVRDGKFDAEVAIVHRGSADWIYYDTDADGAFDRVLFVPVAGEDPTQAFRIAKGATALELDPTSVAGKPLRHKTVFKDKKMGPKWKAIATKLFKPSIIED